MEIYIHAANATFLASFLVRDILRLRVLSVVGGAFLIAFFVQQAPVVWSGIGWNIVFSLINGVQITRLLLERRPVRLTAEEHRLHRLAFRPLSPREMVKLLPCVSFRDASVGERLVEAERDPGRLIVPLAGALDVLVDAERVAQLGAGQFVGEMTFLTRAPPRADVVVSEQGRIAELDAPQLRTLLSGDAELRAALQGILGADVASKLRGVAPAAAAG